MKPKLLIIVLSVLIFILVSALSVGIYFIYNNILLNNLKNEENKISFFKQEITYHYAKFNDLVLNITNTKGRIKLMKLSFSLKSTESSITKILEKNHEEIADIVILLLSSQNSEELLTLEGKTLLKEELLKDLNIYINQILKDDKISSNIINKILFTTFVMK